MISYRHFVLLFPHLIIQRNVRADAAVLFMQIKKIKILQGLFELTVNFRHAVCVVVSGRLVMGGMCWRGIVRDKKLKDRN